MFEQLFTLLLFLSPIIAMVLLFMVVRELRAIRRTVDAMDGTRRRNHGRVAEADPAAEPRVRAMVEQYGRTEAAHRLATSLGIDGATAVLLVDRALAEDADDEPGQDEGRVVPD